MSYYNRIQKECYNFMVKNHYAPTVIRMSFKYYNGLENEIYGNQKRFLIKCNLILGMKAIIDYNVKDFVLE